MRKLDILILKSFIGPFILTTALATFILLIQYMLKYFDDFVGKDLGFAIFGELIFYFSLNMLQVALPLGVLVSSLMTFGNLGEHFELTAIKSAGISLTRAMKPIFFFVVVLTFLAFQFNNHVVPAANLKAYSLLYDIKHKKPALDIKEGVFYNGIPDYSIKAKEKLPDGRTLLDVLIYDHTSGGGNKRVILADSSRMYTMLNDRYLKLELYNGNYYSEQAKNQEPVDQFYRTKFHRMDLVFNLASFDLKRTNEELFQNNRQMKNLEELTYDIDSMRDAMYMSKLGFFTSAKGFFSYHMKSDTLGIPKYQRKYQRIIPSDTLRPKHFLSASVLPFMGNGPALLLDSSSFAQQRPSIEKLRPINRPDRMSPGQLVQMDSLPADSLGTDTLVAQNATPLLDTMSWDFLNNRFTYQKADIIQTAKNTAQNIRVNLTSANSRVNGLKSSVNSFIIERDKKYSQAVACIVMFLIGAPLGAIIKKGGLGFPVIVSILFFIIYYVLTITSEKWAKEDLMNPHWAVWTADLVLLPVGLFFLRQARIDARLFDTDFYDVWLDRLKRRFSKSSD